VDVPGPGHDRPDSGDTEPDRELELEPGHAHVPGSRNTASKREPPGVGRPVAAVQHNRNIAANATVQPQYTGRDHRVRLLENTP
jgi:hypothetical protein